MNGDFYTLYHTLWTILIVDYIFLGTKYTKSGSFSTLACEVLVLHGDFAFKILLVSLKEFSQLGIVIIGVSLPYWCLKLRCTVLTDSVCISHS